MAVDVNSNKYTFIFSAVMVVVVATLLAVAAESLKPMQKENVRKEKQDNILRSGGFQLESRDEAPALFREKLKESMILDADGLEKKDAGIEPFDVDVLKDYKAGMSGIYKANVSDFEAMKAQLLEFDNGKGKAKGANYPLYILTGEDGRDVYVVPMVGTGLWGPIWGYMAIADDGRTVVGAIFDHKSETPGLGSEINQPSFQIPFKGKTIFDGEGRYTGIKVVKGGAKGDEHGVDAISGGTITSNGVTEMIIRTLRIYEPCFLRLQGHGHGVAEVELPADSMLPAIDSLRVEEVADSLKEPSAGGPVVN